MTCRFESCQAHEKKGKTTDDMNPFSRIIHWYFSRKALPYWSVLIFDSVVLFLSGFFAYWLFHRGYATQQHSYQIGKVMLIYIALSWIPMRIFSTYSGIIRYSSFVDLRRLTFANFTSLCIAWAVHYHALRALLYPTAVGNLCHRNGVDVSLARHHQDAVRHHEE